MEFKVEYINPFLLASSQVINMVCQIQTKVGKPYLRSNSYDEDLISIEIGIVGEIKGRAIMVFSMDTACFIASKMMMMPIQELDEISRSAISELGNMIMGNTATILANESIGIDITPPTMRNGKCEIDGPNICIPIHLEDHILEINVSVN